MNVFRLLAGTHEQKEVKRDKEGNPVKDEAGNVVRERVQYRAGDEVPSEKDLVKLLGAGKFQLIGGDSAPGKKAAVIPPDFEAMTVAELKTYAEAHEIDLSGATHKADIVVAVRAAS